MRVSIMAGPMLLMLCWEASPARAQYTEQWSQPTTTGVWSETPAAPPAPPPAPPPPRASTPLPRPAPQPRAVDSGRTSNWSSPTYTHQVDPERMANPDVVANARPHESGLNGRWELWVPGGFWYSSDGTAIYRRYTPGASINRLVIRADGTYRWGDRSGRLIEVRPWFANAGERYYAVQMDAQNRYMARFDAATGKLNLFFWGVGGHAASGTRS
ncbi:hypothetical protein [Allosphingosinicella humi]